MSGLRFNSKNHQYRLDGRITPGVTTLLGKGIPKPAIPYWAAKSVATYVIEHPEDVDRLRAMGIGPAVAALKEIPWQKRDEAAIRGTEVHHYGERVSRGEVEEVPTHLAAHVTGYAEWLDAFEVEILLTERPVASRTWGYCGTFDAIVRWGRGPWKGRTSMIDLKTASGVYGENAIQIAAYAKADWYASEDDEETPLPPIDSTGVVHITEAGTLFYPMARSPEDIDAAFRLFTHIQFVAKKVDWIKTLVGQPMEVE